jgi:hypothetical protein
MGAPDENAGGMIGLRGNAARIYDDHVSFLGPLCAMSRGAQQAADRLAVGPSGPASEVFDVKTGHFPSVKPSPALHEAVPMGAVGQFEGYGLQPVRYPRKISMALAPEGMLIQNDTLPNGEARIRRGAGIFCLNTVRFCILEDDSTPQASSYCPLWVSAAGPRRILTFSDAGKIGAPTMSTHGRAPRAGISKWHKAAKSLPRLRAALLLALLLVFPLERRAEAYSLMTHEMLIDLTWQDSIVPLLLSRYPNLTPAQLEQARAYAYGGCVIQDIGYYPFGDTTVSNLTHYVRSGDFIVNLFRNATNANELAFAVGALSHYIGDSIGHSEATNLAVPLEFPGLGARYGKVVTYADGKRQHVQTEFAFDIDQVAHHRVAPLRFVRHIGLQVPVRQLALAFYQTYGLSEDFSARRGRRFNVRGYRFAVHTLIPRAAYAAASRQSAGGPRFPGDGGYREAGCGRLGGKSLGYLPAQGRF